ncbi:MAG: prolipoprotein diacylglyceryl transferase [Anaerolineales bacterium]|nr:prolipoprotein diacylglyceryl transferase [Anaerolineales bacterium]
MNEGIRLGVLLLRWNGIFIALGIALGFFVAALELKRRYNDVDLIFDLFLPVVVWAWLGARVWHLFTPPLSSIQLGFTAQYYWRHPLDMLSFWVGGYGVAGAMLGGTFALWLSSRKYGFPFWQVADIFALGALLTQAVGRMGNYFNQELYGKPTTLAWAIFISPNHRLQGYESAEFYHPLFAYEIILSLIGFVALFWLSRKFEKRLQAGDLFFAYAAFYSLTRLALEPLRLDVALVNGVNVNQIFFALLFVSSCAAFYIKRLPLRKT